MKTQRRCDAMLKDLTLMALTLMALRTAGVCWIGGVIDECFRVFFGVRNGEKPLYSLARSIFRHPPMYNATRLLGCPIIVGRPGWRSTYLIDIKDIFLGFLR